VSFLNQLERSHIEYRPKLQYSRDLKFLAQQAGLAPSQADTYVLPPEMADALAVPASAVIVQAANTLDQVNAMLADLDQGIPLLVGPVSYADYKAARVQGDPETSSAFERFHADDIAGSAQGELLPHLEEIKAELDALIPRIQQAFFPKGVDMDRLDELQEDEAQSLDRLVVQDMHSPDRTDHKGLASRALLLTAAMEQVQGCASFAEEAGSIMRRTLSDQFQGRLAPVIAQIAAAPSAARTGMGELNKMRLTRLINEGRALRSQAKSLDAPYMRQAAWSASVDLQKMRDQVVAPALNWMKSVAFDWGVNPITALVSEQVSTMERIDREYKEAMLDLYKQNLLELTRRQSILENVRSKKDVRQIHGLLGVVDEQFDTDDPQADRQVRRVVENNNYERPGNIMSM